MPSNIAGRISPVFTSQRGNRAKNGFFRFATMAKVSPLNTRPRFLSCLRGCTVSAIRGLGSDWPRARRLWSVTAVAFGDLLQKAIGQPFFFRLPQVPKSFAGGSHNSGLLCAVL